jgi:hypothetical protein
LFVTKSQALVSVSTVQTALTMSAECAFGTCACFPPPSLSVSMWAAMADFEFCGDFSFIYF